MMYEEDGATVADYRNAAVMMLADVLNDSRVTQLKKVIAVYNERAEVPAQGIEDMFVGKVSKEQIINEIRKALNYGQSEQDQSTPTLTDGQGSGSSGSEQGSPIGTSHSEGERGESGRAEEPQGDRGLQEQRNEGVREIYVGLSDKETENLLSHMEANATEVPQLELNPANWVIQFGEDGTVSIPIGRVKMGANQIAKLFEKGRSDQFGMIKPTLEVPQVVIEVPSESNDGSTERNSSLLFVKTFIGKDGKKIYYFKSVTVKKDGLEVSISSHYDRVKRVKEALKKGKLLYRFDGGAQTEHHPADVSVTTSHGKRQGGSSVDKGTNKSNTAQEYVYQLTQRPYGIGSQPEGQLRHVDDGSKFGSVVYDHPLSAEEVKNFSLTPITEAKALEGRTFEVPFGAEKDIYHVDKVDDDGTIHYHINDEAPLKARYHEFLSELGDEAKELKTDTKTGDETLLDVDGNPVQENSDEKIRYQRSGLNEIETTATEYGMDATLLSNYAKAMSEKNTAAAMNALHDMKAQYLNEHKAEKKTLMEREGISSILANSRLFAPALKAIKEKFGDVDTLIQERIKQAEEEHNMMEAARKRAEEEVKRSEARFEELSQLSFEEIDERYANALANGNEAEAREMLDETARRKGYGDAESEYQGVGAWAAPSNPGYESDEARRNAVGEDSPDLNVADMAAGYSNQPEDIFEYPNKYSQGSSTSVESGKAIQKAIDDIRSGKKDVRIKVYRAVPTSVKEGKLRNGDWVTPSRRYAEMHGENRFEGKYRIIEDEIPANELWWDSNDVNEWGYDNGNDYRYKNAKNNRKLGDLITRDDNGNIIPPSKRFNSRKADERYQKAENKTQTNKRIDHAAFEATTDLVRKALGNDSVITNWEAAQKVLAEENGRARKMSFGEPYDYDKYPRGRVEPNLAEKSVSVVKAEANHGFSNYKEAKDWAKQNISKTYKNEETGGKGIVRISNAAIDKFLSQSAVDKSESKDVHMSVLKVLPDVLKTSIDAETHPDFLKGESGKRDTENGINKDVLVHRCYGAVNIEGKPYRVKITLKEDTRDLSFPHVTHSYEATKIELLAGTWENQKGPSPNTNNSISAAKLLNGVEMSYDSGKNLLEESKKRSEVIREQRAYHGSLAEFDKVDSSHMGEGEGNLAFGYGSYATESKKIGETYAMLGGKGNGFLYTFDIPEDNGHNYFHLDEKVSTEDIATIKQHAIEYLIHNEGYSEKLATQIVNDLGLDSEYIGRDIINSLAYEIPPKEISKILSDMGYVGNSYPADWEYGGGMTGAFGDKRDYVIFNDKNIKVTDKVRFFRTPNGEAYGFTIGGKIYIDPRVATAETPIHEYSHLWATAMKKNNPEEWQNIIGLMKGTPVWEEVKKNYPELTNESDIADEVLAHYSGHKGAERLREEMRKATEGKGSPIEKAEAVSALQRIKKALDKFWKGVADFLHIHYTSAEEVADRVMKDLLDGVDPRKYGVDEKAREQFIGKKGASSADHAEEVSTRMDNLEVARDMEKAEKDAKSIKMATGWERGADGKWRYEIPDGKYFSKGDAEYEKVRNKQSWSKELDLLEDRIFDGEQLSDKESKRFEELANEEAKFKGEYLAQEKPHLANWLKNDELFKAYPELKSVGIVFTDKLPKDTGGYYSVLENKIVVNTNSTIDTESIIAHEVQHAIQQIEGFERGGNPDTVRQQIEDYIKANEEDAEMTEGTVDEAFDLFNKAIKLEVVYPKMINSDVEWQRQTATDAYWDALNTIDNAFRDFDTELKNDYSQFKGMSTYEIAKTGYHMKEVIAELKRMSDEYLNSLTDDDLYLDDLVKRYKRALKSDSNTKLYRKLAGEVEARNVQKRMPMTPEERRASIAAETEDVSRVDQIFLLGGGESYGLNASAEEGGERFRTSEGVGENTQPLLNAIHTLYEKGKDFATKIFNMKFFDVAKTPDFMKELGLTGDKFTIRYGVISRHFGKDGEHTLPEDIWEQLPNALKNPFAITKYYTDEHKQRQKGYRLYTSLKLDSGANVVVSAEVKNAGREIEVNAINTIFGRDRISSTHDELIYTSKEITPEQQALLNENNPRQYLEHRELSTAKVENNSDTLQPSAEEKQSKRATATQLSSAMHLDGEVEVLETNEGLEGRKRNAKGWYDTATGKITVVLGNHESAADVQKTIFHEAVAHKGLRTLVGEENFDTFLDNVYSNAEEGIQHEVDRLANEKYQGDKRVAMEEYMAKLVEDGEFMKPKNRKLFEKVKDFIVDLLKKAGIKLGFKITDNDIRYMLWRSYKNLTEGSHRSVFDVAEDAKMRDKFEQTPEAERRGEQKRREETLFRDGNETIQKAMVDQEEPTHSVLLFACCA